MRENDGVGKGVWGMRPRGRATKKGEGGGGGCGAHARGPDGTSGAWVAVESMPTGKPRVQKKKRKTAAALYDHKWNELVGDEGSGATRAAPTVAWSCVGQNMRGKTCGRSRHHPRPPPPPNHPAQGDKAAASGKGRRGGGGGANGREQQEERRRKEEYAARQKNRTGRARGRRPHRRQTRMGDDALHGHARRWAR